MYALNKRKLQTYPTRMPNIITRPFPEIRHIAGHYMQETTNILNHPVGALIYNKNCEYGIHDQYVYAKTRRGSSLISDTTNGESGFGIARYDNDVYLFWIDTVSKTLKYTIDGVGTVVNTAHGFDVTEDSSFFFYNHPTYPALYITNAVDGVHKVAMDTITVSAVSGSPKISRFAFSHISGRLFGIDDAHTVYWTEIQQTSATDLTNIETWNTSVNFANISPDQGDGFRAIIDDGNATYFFKDIGVWVLPNAFEITDNWIFPKLKIDIGCSAPLTVLNVRYKEKNGIAFLANDNTVRFFTGYVQRNAGTIPTYMEGDSVVLSHEYQYKLDSINRDYFTKSAACFYDQIYMFTYCSNGGSEIDSAICVDLEKGKSYWFDYENYTLSHFERTKDKMYGFDTRGFIVSIFENNKTYDEYPSRLSAYADDEINSGNADVKNIAIRWAFYFSWIKVSDYLNRLVNGYVNFSKNGKKSLNMKVNSFIKGDYIPSFDSGVISQLNTQIENGTYWDLLYWDLNNWSSESVSQTNSGVFSNGEGNYFCIGFYSDDIYETAIIYSIQLNFKQIRRTPNVTN